VDYFYLQKMALRIFLMALVNHPNTYPINVFVIFCPNEDDSTFTTKPLPANEREKSVIKNPVVILIFVFC
jgi:hypothetical protein